MPHRLCQLPAMSRSHETAVSYKWPYRPCLVAFLLIIKCDCTHTLKGTLKEATLTNTDVQGCVCLRDQLAPQRKGFTVPGHIYHYLPFIPQSSSFPLYKQSSSFAQLLQKNTPTALLKAGCLCQRRLRWISKIRCGNQHLTPHM